MDRTRRRLLNGFPAPTREHHDDFCVVEKWEIVRGAAGKPVKHHRTYELALWDQRILRTRISKPVEGTAYGPNMWGHILREQLEVTNDTFWACTLNQTLPDRGGPKVEEHPEALPIFMYRQLREFGVSDEEIGKLTPSTAAELIAEKFRELNR